MERFLVDFSNEHRDDDDDGNGDEDYSVINGMQCRRWVWLFRSCIRGRRTRVPADENTF